MQSTNAWLKQLFSLACLISNGSYISHFITPALWQPSSVHACSWLRSFISVPETAVCVDHCIWSGGQEHCSFQHSDNIMSFQLYIKILSEICGRRGFWRSLLPGMKRLFAFTTTSKVYHLWFHFYAIYVVRCFSVSYHRLLTKKVNLRFICW